MKEVEGIGSKKVLLTRGKGMHIKPKGDKKKGQKITGLRLRKRIRGTTIAEDISQINLKVTKDGAKKLEEIFPDQCQPKTKENRAAKRKAAAEAPKEVPKEEVKVEEAPKESEEAAKPAEEPVEEAPSEANPESSKDDSGEPKEPKEEIPSEPNPEKEPKGEAPKEGIEEAKE
jgi:hypothetical protein